MQYLLVLFSDGLMNQTLLPKCMQGDVHHWIPLLDHFDAYFEKHLKDRSDLQLKVESEDAQDPPFPSAAVVGILRATAAILEHSNNKHLYNSFEVSLLQHLGQSLK